MHIEIERRFLLRTMPELPANAVALRIEQGYLDNSSMLKSREDTSVIRNGRFRKTTRADGSTIFHHTIKVGEGMVRHETEREISEQDFDAAWPATEKQRIEKIRHVVQVGDLTWEVDEFIAPGHPGLFIAEVESHSESAALSIEIPTWLSACIEREVTDDPMYTNRAIARRAGGFES